MAIGSVRFDATDLVKQLGLLESRARNLGPAMHAAGAELLGAIDDNFQSEGGGSWPGFAPSTLRRHPRRAGGLLLQDTGQTANIQLDVGPDFVEAYSPGPASKFHIEGTRHMPKRDFFDLDMGPVLDAMAQVLLAEIV